MSTEFYDIVETDPVAEGKDLVIERALRVLDAVREHRDYSVVHLLAGRESGTIAREIIVVDVESHGVPPTNGVGIQFCERLALSVPANPTQLISVFALRKDFPVLLHQNQPAAGGPVDLCLYFEPAPSVSRTWTPQKFLRRIQWWLVQSAKGALHASDQPVEQLFFVSPFELVLPWNFDALRASGQQFVIRRSGRRPGGGETFFLTPQHSGSRQECPAVPVEVTVPVVAQAPIERHPSNLAELSAALSSRGVDLREAFKRALHLLVNEQGALESATETFTVLILHVPIARTAGAEPETLTRRAFVLLKSPLLVGELLGVLFKHNARFYREADLGAPRAGTWPPEPLMPLEVLQGSDSAAARKQSGLVEPGPSGVVVGAGALGSALLNVWGRSGWGSWTVIDNDHIKPHNLARHSAFAHQIGQPKADVAAELHNAITAGASQVLPVCADATDLANGRVLSAVSGAALVIDATTTLEYPRLVSTRNDVARHISVFMTPDGNAAVLLAENQGRTIRLRTLEAQYYRALINEDWGDRHLMGNLGTYWSGASCRDISTVLPLSRILGLTGVLAEQIPLVAAEEAARIHVWQRHPESGAISARNIRAARERAIPFHELQVFIDEGLEEKLRSLRRDRLPNETGGVLLGYHDLNVGALVLVDALPAPSDSDSSQEFFERGVRDLGAVVSDAERRTADVVRYVGEWHSHPMGFTSTPSRRDLIQLAYLAARMAEDGLPAVSVIVSETEIRVMGGKVTR